VSAALESEGMVQATLGENRDAARFEWFMPSAGVMGAR
jgi:hypothetical protein